MCGRLLYLAYTPRGAQVVYPELIEKAKMRVLIYNGERGGRLRCARDPSPYPPPTPGEADACVPVTDNEWWTTSMNYTLKQGARDDAGERRGVCGATHSRPISCRHATLASVDDGLGGRRRLRHAVRASGRHLHLHDHPGRRAHGAARRMRASSFVWACKHPTCWCRCPKTRLRRPTRCSSRSSQARPGRLEWGIDLGGTGETSYIVFDKVGEGVIITEVRLGDPVNLK